MTWRRGRARTPVEGVPNPDGIIGPDPYYSEFNRLGVRVPTLLISPWIDKGSEKLPEGKEMDVGNGHRYVEDAVKRFLEAGRACPEGWRPTIHHEGPP
ncbi:hypothetical protein SASPL_138244 [Salvia splendens]|uniref:Uncharacterized protein n=1 Tax=Salvia splendens TaxID=180675 RepID=A0A8X8WWJ0_SALSN|nr:hypothetical protein SASPL_138244 [Salvia splendens]